MDEARFWAVVEAGGAEVLFPENNLARLHPGQAGA
jgi:hypothetical protein